MSTNLTQRLFVFPLFLSSVTYAADPDAHRLLLEAEDFGNMICYPDDRPELKKWYAREATCRHYGAPGRGTIAAIHDRANTSDRTTTLDLTKSPIPAGSYKVFARVAGNIFQDDDNILRLNLGESHADFHWQHKGHPTWLEGIDIVLKSPVEKVQMTAVQFGGIGLRILYECQARSIWADSFYITSDLTEGPPTWAVEQSLRTGLKPIAEMFDQKFKLETPAIEQHNTPRVADEPVASVIKLESFDSRNNVWPNASFELGLNDGWAAINNSYTYAYIFSERDHAKDAAHGDYSLRIPARADPFSRIYLLAKVGRHTLSAFLKSEQPTDITLSLLSMEGKSGKDRGKPILSAECKVTNKWQRFHVSGDVQSGYVCMQIKNSSEIWLDGIQLESGELSEFQPRAAVEGAVTSDKLGNILHDDKDKSLSLWLSNSSDKPVDAVIAYRIVDVQESVIEEGKTKAVRVEANSTVRTEIARPDRKGLFSVLYSLDGRRLPEGELVYAVIPTPSTKKTRHELASNMDCLPAAYELMQRMGFKWQFYCKIVTTAAIAMQPEPGEFKWDDVQLGLGKEYGMQTLPCLWPTRLPEWMIDRNRMSPERRDIVRMTRNDKPPPYPKLDAWREYSRKLADHYKTVVDTWTIEDETEMYYSARDFAPIVRATALGMKEADPSIKIGLSCMPDYTEELLTMVEPKFIGAIGASSYGFLGHWPGRKIRHLQNRLSVPWHCIGVGNNDSHVQMFHTMYGYQPIYWAAARTARELVDLCLNQDAKVIGHYTGRLWNRNGHYNTDFPLMDYDGTPLPHGFAYACVGLLLADAVPLGDIKIESTGTLAYLFELNGRMGAATWATLVPYYDLHWKPADRNFKNFTLAASPDQVELLDMFGNQMKGNQSDPNLLSLDLGEAPVFFMDKGLGKDRFIESIQKATVDAPSVKSRLRFVSNGTGGIDLAITATNTGNADVKDLKLDARVPLNKMLSKTEWMLPLDARADFGELKRGETRTGRLVTSITGKAPVENATFQVSLTDGNNSFPVYDTLWLLNAPRRAEDISPTPKITFPPEYPWTPGWIYYTYSWGRFGRDFPQIHENGEHFNYSTMLDLKSTILAAWDDKNLKLKIVIEDDQLVIGNPAEQRDSLEIRIDVNDDGFVFPKEEFKGDDRVLVLQDEGKNHSVNSAGFVGKQVQELSFSKLADGQNQHWSITIPWQALGIMKPEPGKIIGFDVVITDVDMEDGKRTESKMRWAGNSKGLGQLLLTE
ncbi:MAG: hypothetical protein O3B01_02695 [Planctomycetota bacterium]|nr:hypothetical protein [Planctomycetota bacterium]